jgi:hypothetical protein
MRNPGSRSISKVRDSQKLLERHLLSRKCKLGQQEKIMSLAKNILIG